MTETLATPPTARPDHHGKLQRYELLDELGGGQTVTYLARVRDSGEKVVVKMLDVRQTTEWKAVELFEREVEVLRRLDHPAIPGLVDAFVEKEPEEKEQEEDRDRPVEAIRLYLVQEYVDGADLERAVKDEGFRVDEPAARAIAKELLEILSYLHAQNPPVVHRDLKPANIVRGPDERLHLVDFGAVGRLAATRDGSTIIGSAGYVPAEQLAGRAQPASDLYALGATLVFLLARRPPTELPFERMRLGFRDAVNVSDAFADFLDRLLAPAPDDRPKDAAEALALLENPAPQLPVRWTGNLQNLPRKYRPPEGTKISVAQSRGRLEATIPGRFQPLMLLATLVSLLPGSLGLLSLLDGKAIIGSIYYLLPFVGCSSLLILLWVVKTRLVLTPERFEIVQEALGLRRTRSIPVSDYRGLRDKKLQRNPTYELNLKSAGEHDGARFATGLSHPEARWLAEVFAPRDAQVDREE